MSEKLFPVYTAKEVKKVMKLTVSDDVLERFKTPPEPSPRRIVVFHPGMSLLAQQELVGEKLLRIHSDLKERPLASAPVTPGYYEVCLPAPETQDLTFDRQVKAVQPFGEVACPVAIASWAWLVCYRKTGESLGYGLWMRCAEESSPGGRVGIFAGAGWLVVDDGWGDGRYDDVRLASLGTSGKGNLKP